MDKDQGPGISTGFLAVAIIPGIIFLTGVTSLMLAKSYQMVREANAQNK